MSSGLREAVFLERLNRFLVRVRTDGRAEEAHLPNSGRLRELLVPGARALLRETWHPGRKTKYNLWAVHTGKIWVCVDAQHANDLFLRVVHQDLIVELEGVVTVRREVPFNGIRVDFLIGTAGDSHAVEVKSVTLVRDGVALFPDAPTNRGRRHLEALIRAVEKGQRGGVGFMVQRSDATSFAPNGLTDPDFAAGLRMAARKGVWVAACKFEVGRGWVGAGEPIPVTL